MTPPGASRAGHHLDGKVGVVTGAATGIGRSTALELAARGAHVALFDIDLECLEETLSLLNGAPGASIHGIDVSNADQVTQGITHLSKTHGRLDFVVNNAAWYIVSSLTETNDEDWQKTLDSTLTSVFLMSRAAIPAMIRTGGGSIVNIASINQRVANPHHSAYTAAKGGVKALTQQVAVEYGPHGVRCNSVSPGLILTDAIKARMSEEDLEMNREAYPIGRLGAVEDVAHAVAYLVCDEASFITGVDLPVDGGLTALSPAAPVAPGLRRLWGRRPLRLLEHDEE